MFTSPFISYYAAIPGDQEESTVTPLNFHWIDVLPNCYHKLSEDGIDRNE